MSEFAALETIYRIIDRWFNDENCRGLFATETGWQRKAEINWYAYFVLLFAQVEKHIVEEFNNSIYNDAEARFAHRVNILYSQGTPMAERILELYSYRNEIAHGYIDPYYWPRVVAQDSAPVAFDDDLRFLRKVLET